MTLHSFRSRCRSLMLADWLVYCRPAAKDWDVSPVFALCQRRTRCKTGIKLSSGGTLATFLGQKHDIALITPMTKLVILEYPDPRLRKKAAPVTVVDDAMRQLADNMLETMYAAKGVGLAATQVDVHERLIVLDVSEERDRPLVLINPELLKLEGSGPGRRGMPVAARHLRQSVARHPYSRARTGPRRRSRSRWMRMACSQSASSMKWTISKASCSSTTSRSSSAS